MSRKAQHSALAAIAFAGLAFGSAGWASPPVAARDRAQAPDASEHVGSPDAPQHLTGTVISVDPFGKELTVKRDRVDEEEVTTFTASPAAASLLAHLTPGERVTIAYDREHGHLVAIRIDTDRPERDQPEPR